MTIIINNTEAALLNNATTKPYFDGTRPTGSTDFSNLPANQPQKTVLTNNLVTFFGAALQCSDGTIGTYQGGALDAVHKRMGIPDNVFDTFNLIVLEVTGFLGVTPADNQAILGVLNSTRSLIVFPPTICDKYSLILNKTNLDLVTTIVGGTEGNLLANALTRPFFDGTRPKPSTNFTSNGPALTALTTSLVRFFGQFGVLGCTDGTIPFYTGEPSMFIVHNKMGITGPVFDAFNQALLQVTSGAGVTPQDNDAILAVLETLRPAIVRNRTICEKYAEILNKTHLELVTILVTDQEQQLLADSTQKPFFDGTKGPIDFTSNAIQLQRLTTNLITFFGQFAVLGCSDGTIDVYAGQTLTAAHTGLPIDDTIFDRFNTLLVGVAASNGVTPPDQLAILGILNSTRSQIVGLGGGPTAAPQPTASPAGGGNQRYNVTCGPPPLRCGGGGGVYTLTQTFPTVGLPNGDPTILCKVGDVITFNLVAPLPGHPLSIVDSAGGTYPGVDARFASPGGFTGPGSIDFTCPASLAANPARYYCLVHGPGGSMNGPIQLIGGSPPTKAPTNAGPPTLCEKYAAILNFTHKQLITAVVSGTEAKLLQDPITRPYFDGTRPTGSVNFPQNAGALGVLTTNLITFFGAALGCSDGTIGSYAGRPLDVVHRPMGINDTVFNQFNTLLLQVTAGAGVTPQDNAAILTVLVCNEPIAIIIYKFTIASKGLMIQLFSHQQFVINMQMR